MEQTTQQLIDKFWNGTATETEKQWLADALDAPGAEWQADLRQAFNRQPSSTGPLTDEQANRVLLRLHRHILGETNAQSRFTIWRQWSRWAAAAVVLLVGGLSVWLYTRPTSQPVVHHQSASLWHLTNRTNRTATRLMIHLADGSTVTLEPGSSVSYYDPFGRAGRNISLTGEGLFDVAKDKTHPFTVLANGFTTTALGTKFRVRTVGKKQVSVRLLEGLVVVKATDVNNLLIQDTYLRPGQELSISPVSNKLTVTEFRKITGPGAAPPAARPVPLPLPVLLFTKEPLSDVFTRVGRRFNVPIDYNPADVQGLSFSGSFAAADSLPVVLQAICLTNDLSFKQESGRITIVRSP